MSNVIEQKKQVVDEIAEKLQASNSIVVVDYRGLNVAEVTELPYRMRYPQQEQTLNGESRKAAVDQLSNGDVVYSKLWWITR